MLSLIKHRGPDGQSVFNNSGISLGMVIQNTSNIKLPKLPLHNQNEDIWLFCDGGIYNANITYERIGVIYTDHVDQTKILEVVDSNICKTNF